MNTARKRKAANDWFAADIFYDNGISSISNSLAQPVLHKLCFNFFSWP